MIYNISRDTFDIIGQGLRNGDLIAVCNVIEHLRKENQQVQFFLPVETLQDQQYVRDFFNHLLETTDYFSKISGDKDLPWKRVMLWDYRDIIGDNVLIPNESNQEKKIVIFPVYDAQYNGNRNWTQDLLMKILMYCNFNYPDHKKVICAKDDLSNYMDLTGFEMSIDFLTNVNHIRTAEVYVGGDTGMTHFASALNNGPKELIYYYNGRGMLHSLPFYSLEGKGTIVKFWHNFENTTF
jgi:predicted GNAT family N-acyltransferase